MSTGQSSRYWEINIGGSDPNSAIDSAQLAVRWGTTLFDQGAAPGSQQWLFTQLSGWVPSGGGSGSSFPLEGNVSAAGYLIRDLGVALLGTDAANLDVVQDEIAAALAALVIDTAQIADLAVTTGKIANLAVTTAKLDNLAVTTAKIDNLAVTTGKIADLAITAAKLAVGAIVAVGAVGATTAYTGATNVLAATEPASALTASAVLSPLYTYHDINISAISQTFSLPAAAAIGDVHVLNDFGNNWSTYNITVDVQGGGTIQNGLAGAPASVALANSGQARTFRKIGATAWQLWQ